MATIVPWRGAVKTTAQLATAPLHQNLPLAQRPEINAASLGPTKVAKAAGGIR